MRLFVFVFASLFALGADGQTGRRTVPIVDPVLGMTAYTLEVPQDWRVDGGMTPGTTCSAGTSPTYRAFSADGKTGRFLLPRIDWAWGTNAGKDCNLFPGIVPAKDVITYFIRLRQLGFVNELPVPQLDQMKKQSEDQTRQARAQSPAMQPTFSIDMARFLVRYSLNGQGMEESVTATTSCVESTMLAIGRVHTCSAFIERIFTPRGKLDAMVPMMAGMKLSINPEWNQAWTDTMVRHIRQLSQQQTQAMLKRGEVAANQRMREHQQFMASMQQGRDLSNLQFQEHLYNKTEQKEDFVDYITDCQRLTNGYTRLSVGNCQARETGGY